jgi:hypothetical protein
MTTTTTAAAEKYSQPQIADMRDEGAHAWTTFGDQGFLQNPYLYGPATPAGARIWWEGYNSARIHARRQASLAGMTLMSDPIVKIAEAKVRQKIAQQKPAERRKKSKLPQYGGASNET